MPKGLFLSELSLKKLACLLFDEMRDVLPLAIHVFLRMNIVAW